ncbi:MAG: DUF1553 domain-containing protein, partial [Bryobacteraceae bacterium]|nr:DUF1553 domain-containing protein [Bryobacteraceae bacterium]
SHIAVVADGSGKASGLKIFFNGMPAVTDVLKDSLTGSFANQSDILIGTKEADSKPFSGSLDDLRFYSRALPADEIRETGIQYPVQTVLSGLGGKPSKTDLERVKDHYFRYVAPVEVRREYTDLNELKSKSKQLEKEILTTMVMDELDKPRDTFVLARGDYRNTAEKVEPNTLAILPPLQHEGRPTRLDLARWLVNPSHPLTARVAVNRYWQMYFGTGLVKTAENFGSQGEPPSNQELLDWLSTEFTRTGWDVKTMQKLIVTSATYKQASKVSAELVAKDPENRLLARGPRFRLPAELLRDNALAVSGLLNSDLGGPSVFPYQPPGLWEELAFGDGFSMQTYVQSHGRDLYRRSMYTFWKRTGPPAQLATFDAPDREKCTTRRTLTNTPLQALVLLNDPTYIEAARALAQRVLREAGPSPEKRASLAFELATAQLPDRQELTVLVGLAKQQLEYFRRTPAEAAALLKNGESPVDPTMKPVELAAWTTVASAILNLDETISKE